MENENQGQEAGETVEPTEEQKAEAAAKAEQEASEAKAKEGAEAAASDAAGSGEGKETTLAVGGGVIFNLAIGQVRDAFVRAVNADGTLDVSFPVADGDLPYLPEEERGLSEVVRCGVQLGELGKGSGTWSPKA